jgi:hypothetical protein
MAFPPFAAALFALGADRKFGAHIFDPANGGAILWQHLFWFFGHPEVYIIALPFFGIVSEIFPVFSRKPLFGYKGIVFATIAIGALSVTVWAHHMYATGAVLLPFFAFMTMLIAVPTGVKFFNWIGTMWRGSITFETPMLWSIGFLVTFLFGGLTGIILASPPLDFHVTDSYFVVAHFHYVVFGTVVFAMFAGFYFWWPKWTGTMLNERLGKIHFWMLFVGFHATFLIHHWLGVEGMPRRYADYLPEDNFTFMNQFSTIGSYLLGASLLPFFWNVYVTWRKGEKVEVDDPWGFGASLEWATFRTTRAGPAPSGNQHPGTQPRPQRRGRRAWRSRYRRPGRPRPEPRQMTAPVPRESGRIQREYTDHAASTTGSSEPVIPPLLKPDRQSCIQNLLRPGNQARESPISRHSSPSPDAASTSSGPCSATTPFTEKQRRSSAPKLLDDSIEIPNDPLRYGRQYGLAGHRRGDLGRHWPRCRHQPTGSPRRWNNQGQD